MDRVAREKLKWKCRQGLLELDLVLARYMERHATGMTDGEAAALGELPTRKEKDQFVYTVIHHSMVHEQLSRFFTGFRCDAHPIATMVGVVEALSAFYHDALDISNPEHRKISLGEEPGTEFAALARAAWARLEYQL